MFMKREKFKKKGKRDWATRGVDLFLTCKFLGAADTLIHVKMSGPLSSINCIIIACHLSALTKTVKRPTFGFTSFRLDFIAL